MATLQNSAMAAKSASMKKSGSAPANMNIGPGRGASAASGQKSGEVASKQAATFKGTRAGV